MEPQDIKIKTIHGVTWRGISTIIQFILSLALTIFFMQYILPEDYGIIAKVVIVFGLLNVFLDFGYSQAIIQQKSESDENLSSHVYWSFLIALLLTIVFIIFIPFIAQWYNDIRLQNIFYLLSLSLLFGGSIIVQRAILHKKLAFKKLAFIELSTFIISAIISIILVLYGYGYKAIVAQMFVSSVLQCALFWLTKDFRLRSKFDLSHIKSSSKFSIFIFLSRFTDFMIELFDQFLISLYFPLKILGSYNRAASIMRTPINIIPGTLSQVLFPLFSSIQLDTSKEASLRINSIYIRSHNLIVILFVPIFLTSFFYADSIINVLFPDKWSSMVPFFKILALIACVSITALEGSVVLAYGKSESFLYYSLPGKIIIIASLWMGIQFGILNMLWGLLIGAIMSKSLMIYLLHNQFQLKFSTFVQELLGSLWVAILIEIIVLGASHFFSNPLYQVICIILTYLASLTFLITFVPHPSFRDMKMLFGQLTKN